MRQRNKKQSRAFSTQEKPQLRIYHIGDFSKSYATPNYIAHALEEQGHIVKKFQENREYTTDSLVGEIQKFNPDFVLFHKLNIWGNKIGFIQRLQKEGIKNVCWLFDLYHGLPRGLWTRTKYDSQFQADIVFTTDGGHQEEWDKLKVNHRVLRQGIHEPEHQLLEAEKEYDIIFVGSSTYYYRTKLLSWLKNTYGDRFHHFGDIGQPQVRGMSLNKLFAKSKIVMGDSVPTPHYWSNRVYETLGRGGFLIHPQTIGLSDEFKPFKHYVPYERGNFKQLGQIIDHYLENDKEREKIRQQGFKQASKFTYAERCRELIKVLRKEGFLG